MVIMSRLSFHKEVSMNFVHLLVFLILGTWRCLLGGQIVAEGQSGGQETATCLQELQQQLGSHGWMREVSIGHQSVNRMCYAHRTPCTYLVGAKQLEGLLNNLDQSKGNAIKHILVVFSDREGLVKAKRIVIEGKKMYPSLNFLGLLQATDCKAVAYATRLHEYLTGVQHHVIVRRNVLDNLASESSNIIQASLSKQVKDYSSVHIMVAKSEPVSMSTRSESVVDKPSTNIVVSPSLEPSVSHFQQSSSVAESHVTKLQKKSSFVISSQSPSISISVDKSSPLMSSAKTSSSSQSASNSVVEDSKVTFLSQKTTFPISVRSSVAESMKHSQANSSPPIRATETMSSTANLNSRSMISKARTTSITEMQTARQTTRTPAETTHVKPAKSLSSIQERLTQTLPSIALQTSASHSVKISYSRSSVMSIRLTPSIAGSASRIMSVSHSVSLVSSMSLSESLPPLSRTTSPSFSMSPSLASPKTLLATKTHAPTASLSLLKTTSQLLAVSTSPSAPAVKTVTLQTQGTVAPSSVLSSSPSPSPSLSPSPTQPPSARYQVKLDGNCTFLGNVSLKRELETRFQSKVASSLGVDVALVLVENIRCGSVVITFRVTSPAANTETVLRNIFTKNYTVQIGTEELKGVELTVLTAPTPSPTSTGPMTTSRRLVVSTSTTLKPTPSPKPTGKPGKKNDDAMILYIAIGCVAGVVLLVIIVVAIRGCRQRAIKGALTINDKADFELGHFQSIPRAKVKMYGAERESRTDSFDAPYSGYTDTPVSTQLRLQDDNHLSGSRDNLINSSGKLRGIDNPALAHEGQDEK